MFNSQPKNDSGTPDRITNPLLSKKEQEEVKSFDAAADAAENGVAGTQAESNTDDPQEDCCHWCLGSFVVLGSCLRTTADIVFCGF